MNTTPTETHLRQVIILYARSRGTRPVLEICLGMHSAMLDFARAQDCIGWRRFMEGMVSSQAMKIQHNFLWCYGWKGGAGKWSHMLITKLMECTQGQ